MAALRDLRATTGSISCRTLILLCVFLLTHAVSAADDVAQEKSIEKLLPSDDVSLVVVKGVSGNIKLSSWERLEILVKATKKVIADNGEHAQEYLDQVEVRMQKAEDRIEIATIQPPDIAAAVSVEYDIFAPENMDIDISGVDSSIYVIGNRGQEAVNTVNGDIQLKDVVGSVSARTTNGNIYAEMLFDDESHFSTTNGSIEIQIGDEFSVPMYAQTVSGSIRVAIPEGFSADIEAVVRSGVISCDLPFDGSVEEHSLSGKIFGGGELLRLRAIDGNIAIAKAPARPSGATSEPERDQVQPQLQLETTEPLREPPKAPAIPQAEAIRTLSPPIVDGRLDDKCWKSAGRIRNFVWADGTRSPYETTEAYLLWDDRNLYIGIKCYESRMDTIKVTNIETDYEASEDDTVQIFIDPTPETEASYYHMAVSPIGVVFDQEVSGADVAKHMIESSEPGVKWNSDGQFDADIRSDSWTVEAGIPLSALRAMPGEGDTWRFNLYRVGQRRKEYTFWSPTYGSEKWPHVPARFGKLAFTVGQLIAETPPGRPIPSEEALAIADIAVQGNSEISQEEIMETLGLNPGDLADVDVLSHAKSRLESMGWFENVGMDLTENHEGVDLIVRVMEKEIISPSQVQIQNSRLFTEEQIIDYFNLAPARTTAQDVGVKCGLIEELYRARGHEMVSVSSSVVANALIIDIDEGYIDKIEIRGNKKVRTKDIMDSLDLRPGMPYEQAEIDRAVHTMKAELPYFRTVDWKPGRSDDGLNIVYVDVREADLIEPDLDMIGEFNRVHGLKLGLRSELKSTYGGARGFCEFSRGFSSEIWNYEFGIEKSWFGKRKSTVGANVHRITDTNDWELVSDVENFIAEAILGEAWRDFYQRQGYELSLGHRLAAFTELGLKYSDDEYASLAKTSDWSVLNRSYENDDWYDEFEWSGGSGIHSREMYRTDGEKYKPENPPIEEGAMRSLSAECTIDTRNSEGDPTSGWLSTFSAEYAGGGMGGDFDFALCKVNIRKYNRLSGNQFFNFRLKAATTDRELSPLHPRKFYLGGIGTLRGYRFKEFSGDKMVLINAEYWVMTRWPPGVGIVFFLDSGYAWPYRSKVKVADMETNLGIGFQLGGLRVNLASPVREVDKETVLSARISRMF